MLAPLSRVPLGAINFFNNQTTLLTLSSLFDAVEFLGAGEDGVVFGAQIRDAATVANLNTIGQGTVHLGVKYAVKFLLETGDKPVRSPFSNEIVVPMLYSPESEIGERMRRSQQVFDNVVNMQMWLHLRLDRDSLAQQPALAVPLRLGSESVFSSRLNWVIHASHAVEKDRHIPCTLIIMERIDYSLGTALLNGLLSVPNNTSAADAPLFALANLERSGITVAAIMAQAIAGMISVRRILPDISHGDLHINNVALSFTPHYDFIVYGIPPTKAFNRHQALVVPLQATRHSIVKLMDFGRAKTMSYYTTVPLTSPPDRVRAPDGVPWENVFNLAESLVNLAVYRKDPGNIRDRPDDPPNRLETMRARSVIDALLSDGLAPAWVGVGERFLRDLTDPGVPHMGLYKDFFDASRPNKTEKGGDYRIIAQLENPDYFLHLMAQMPLLSILRCDNNIAAIQAKMASLSAALNGAALPCSVFQAAERVMVVNLEHAASHLAQEAVAAEISTVQ